MKDPHSICAKRVRLDLGLLKNRNSPAKSEKSTVLDRSFRMELLFQLFQA